MGAKINKIEINNDNDGYNLYFNGADINVAVFGCDGTGEKDQQANANAIKAKAQTGEIQFAIHLGDAIYSWNNNGASKYSELERQLVTPHEGTDIPFFMVPGNHDKNIHRVSFSYEKGIENHQKLNNFYQGDPYQDDDGSHEVPKLTDTKSIENKFNARPKNPGNAEHDNKTYYSVSCFNNNDSTEAEVEYLLIDTNSLPYDEDQKGWIRNKINNSIAKNIVICCHHPILTFDKRLLSRQDSRYYKKSALAAANDESEKAAINKKHSVYKRQYGLSQNAILKGIFRDEIFGNNKLAESQKEKVCGFFTAHNHWQGTVVGKKSWEKIVTQGAAGKSTSLPKHRCLDLKQKIRHSEKETGFGIAKSEPQKFYIENHIVKAGGEETEKSDNDIILKGNDALLYQQNSNEDKCQEVKRKLTGFDKILRDFVRLHKDECCKGGRYDILTRNARYLHNRLLYDFRNHIKNLDPEQAVEHLGSIAECAAAFLVHLAPTENNDDHAKVFQERFNKQASNFNKKQLLAHKHFYHMPYFRFAAIALFGALVIAAVAVSLFFPPATAYLCIVGLVLANKIEIIAGVTSLLFAAGVFAEYKTWRCRSSKQFEFFREAEKLFDQQKELSTLPSCQHV